jgi:hypothetical protein
MAKTKGKTNPKARAATNGLNRSERARRSRLAEDHELRISPEDPLYLPPQREKPMLRYGHNLKKFYRCFNTSTRQWVEWNKELHEAKDKIEESALHRFARLNQNTPDLVVEENYDIGASSAISLNLSLNKPNSTGSSGASNNEEWCKYLAFLLIGFPNSKEAKLVMSWQNNKLLTEDPQFGPWESGESQLQKDKDGAWYRFSTAEGELVTYTPAQYAQRFETIYCAAAHLVPEDSDNSAVKKSLLSATTYSVRKASRKWAKLSGAGEDDCAPAGRWSKNSNNQLAYSQAGLFESELNSAYTEYDALTKVMTFKHVTTMELNDNAALENHVLFRGY